MTNPRTDAPGGGLYVAEWGEIEHCTLIANVACCAYEQPHNYRNAGGMHVQNGFVRNTLVADTDEGLVCTGDATWSCTALYNNTQGNEPCAPSGVNFTDDPLFCVSNFLDTEEFGLHSDSPYIDAPGCGLIGAVAEGCGPTAVRATPWADVKRRFR